MLSIVRSIYKTVIYSIVIRSFTCSNSEPCDINERDMNKNWKWNLVENRFRPAKLSSSINIYTSEKWLNRRMKREKWLISTEYIKLEYCETFFLCLIIKHATYRHWQQQDHTRKDVHWLKFYLISWHCIIIIHSIKFLCTMSKQISIPEEDWRLTEERERSRWIFALIRSPLY